MIILGNILMQTVFKIIGENLEILQPQSINFTNKGFIPHVPAHICP